MKVKPGMRLRSAVCETEVMVTRAPAEELDLTCGGVPMADLGAEVPAAEPTGAMGGTLIGKRYTDESGAFEVLCTKGGAGSLALDGAELLVKGAKPLPASD
jgi:hypothetical protein